MAAMVEPDKSTAALIQVATFAYRFPLPATRLINFEECFARNMGAEETAKAISAMSQGRDDLAHELASGTPNYSNAVAGAERYVPLIAQTLYSLEQSTEPVYLNKPLSFTWATGIGKKPRKDWITNQAVVWDKCMALASQAMAHADAVHNMLDDGSGPGARYAEASVQLKTAAGIFEQLHKEELPRWVGETSKVPRIPEAEGGVCEGLAHFCLAEAQQMAIGKALSSPAATPLTLLAKLSLGVVQLLETAVSTMRQKAGAAYSNLDSPFLHHITLHLNVFQGLACRFLAIHSWNEDKYGLGIAYMHKACSYIKPRADVTSTGLPALEGPLAAVAGPVRALQGEFNALRDSYIKDNSSIYYEPVPNQDELELPTPAIMMKALPRPAAGAPAVLSFRGPGEKPAAGEGGAEEGEGGGGGGDAAGAGKTDAELAQELHEKLNAS